MIHEVGKTYACAECGETLIEGRDDEAAHAEAVENFGKRGDAPGMVRICDDCYKELMAWMNEPARES